VDVSEIADIAVGALEIVGVAVVVGGALIFTVRFLISLARREPHKDAYTDYRHGLGRGILLGLEFLVAADIIRTVAIELTLESVATLGLLVLVRTFLSLALEVEMTGSWPWRMRSEGEQQGVSDRGG
jgi:uncharacterized membrane protein